MQINQVQFDAVVEAAKASAASDAAWVRAIEKAAEYLHSNPYIHDEGDGLLILSDSGETYKANGVCQCRAFAHGRPCWHRAAAKLIKRYKEAMAAQVATPAPVEVVTTAAPAVATVSTMPAQSACSLVERIEQSYGGMRFKAYYCDGWAV